MQYFETASQWKELKGDELMQIHIAKGCWWSRDTSTWVENAQINICNYPGKMRFKTGFKIRQSIHTHSQDLFSQKETTFLQLWTVCGQKMWKPPGAKNVPHSVLYVNTSCLLSWRVNTNPLRKSIHADPLLLCTAQTWFGSHLIKLAYIILSLDFREHCYKLSLSPWHYWNVWMLGDMQFLCCMETVLPQHH